MSSYHPPFGYGRQDPNVLHGVSSAPSSRLSASSPATASLLEARAANMAIGDHLADTNLFRAVKPFGENKQHVRRRGAASSAP